MLWNLIGVLEMQKKEKGLLKLCTRTGWMRIYSQDVVSTYITKKRYMQAGLDEEDKKCFWEDLDDGERYPLTENLFIGCHFNGHVGSTSRGYDDVHEGFGFGHRNKSGASLLDFARISGLVVASSSSRRKISTW